MGIIKETIVGTKIICEIKSSNLKRAEYDTTTKVMLVEFNNGLKYEYYDVPHQIFTQMRMAPSQGNFFGTKISKTFKYKKI
jgi:hypothetical protein